MIVYFIVNILLFSLCKVSFLGLHVSEGVRTYFHKQHRTQSNKKRCDTQSVISVDSIYLNKVAKMKVLWLSTHKMLSYTVFKKDIGISVRILLLLLHCCFTSTVNILGHVGTVS